MMMTVQYFKNFILTFAIAIGIFHTTMAYEMSTDDFANNSNEKLDFLVLDSSSSENSETAVTKQLKQHDSTSVRQVLTPEQVAIFEKALYTPRESLEIMTIAELSFLGISICLVIVAIVLAIKLIVKIFSNGDHKDNHGDEDKHSNENTTLCSEYDISNAANNV